MSLSCARRPSITRLQRHLDATSPLPRLDVGWHTLPGWKISHAHTWLNQDALLTVSLPGNRLLAAVFDGHGEHGHHVASTAREVFSQQAQTFLCSWLHDGPAVAFGQLFAMCQSKLRSEEGLCEFAGATASCALVDPLARCVTLAHVGDSTCLLLCGGSVVHVTADHKFDAEAERRIQACGGEVRFLNGCHRVYGRGLGRPGLAMSRSLGDLEATQYGVISEPEVSPTLPFEPGSALVLASDGLWDMLPPAAVAADPFDRDAQEAASTLVLRAQELWPDNGDIDDITAIVVRSV